MDPLLFPSMVVASILGSACNSGNANHSSCIFPELHTAAAVVVMDPLLFPSAAAIAVATICFSAAEIQFHNGKNNSTMAPKEVGDWGFRVGRGITMQMKSPHLST
jgi:hypothetical protein